MSKWKMFYYRNDTLTVQKLVEKLPVTEFLNSFTKTDETREKSTAAAYTKIIVQAYFLTNC